MNPYSNKVFSQAQFKDANVPQEMLSGIPSDSQNAFSVRRSKPVIFLSVVFLVLCLLLLPWPTRIDLTLPGGRISAEGELLQEGSIHLEGWRYNYLLRRDSIKVAVAVPDLTLSETPWQKIPYYEFSSEGYLHTFQLVYVSEMNEFEGCSLNIARDGSWCLIQVGDYLYYGSNHPEITSKAVLNACWAVVY